MFDLVIRGATAVTPHGAGAYDLAVKGEKIAAVAQRGGLPDGESRRTIDAEGLIAIPGGIDPHVHCSWHIPLPDGTPGLSDPPSQVSRAALFGGTTTLIDFARWRHGVATLREAIETRDGDWAGQCHCDYAYHVMVEGDPPPEIVAELRECVEAGYPTAKLFTTDITPSRKGRMLDFGDLWEIFKVLAPAGGLAVVHAEDNDIVMHMYEKLFREGRAGFENMSEVHNALSEDLSFRRIIRLAENVGGMALYMMHVSAASGVSAVRDSRSRGFPVYGESLHQYMLFTEDDYRRPNGQIYHTYPSLKTQADQDALWAGVADGSINCVATDEICCSLATKVIGRRVDDTTGGNAGVEPRVAVIYTEMVSRRGHALEKFVDLVSTNAARIMGLYPRKGALAPGSDADIVLLDPRQTRTVRVEMLHETDYSPWEGREVTAWPVVTVLRGKVVVENGEFHGTVADGRYLHRSVPETIRSGPRL